MSAFAFAIVSQLFILCVCFTVSPPPSTKASIRCRTERRQYMPYEQYRMDVCARCYLYMPSSKFNFKLQYDSLSSHLHDKRTNVTYSADPFNDSQASLFGTFLGKSAVDQWRDCCKAAWQCCDRMVKDPPTTLVVYCPRTWDGWQCWEDTPAGTTVSQPCPDHLYTRSRAPSCSRYAHKICLPNGTWSFKPGTSREWTNYEGCGQGEYHRNNMKFHMAMYIVTIVALVPALLIFVMHKQLQVHRISMHKNLFMSLLLHGVCVVLFKCLVIIPEMNKPSLNYRTTLQANGALCKVLLILTKYFRMTNYLWMFCEGYYLHKLIVAAFAEQKTLRMFYAIGWVFPVVPVSIYAIVRATLENNTCWAFPAQPYEWIMDLPNLMSLCVNMFFLCNIIRVLVTKLRATHANEPSQYRKAVRATLVMMPLFGLHFCFTLYRPSTGKCGLFEAYVYFNNALDGLQGFMVAVIFCYLNGEVLYLLKRSYQRFKLQLQIMRSSHPIHQSEKKRKWSATQESSMTESQNHHHHHHHHHFHKTRYAENKLKEMDNHTKEKDNNHGQKLDSEI